MSPKIHTYTSEEPMLRVNAFIVEAEHELVIVDTTLTMSDSKNLKQKADAIGKPLAGIILTHGHPDHIAGTANIVPEGNVPIYALPSVEKLMKETEEAKHRQWSEVFGDEWVPGWVYPNTLVMGGETVTIAGLRFNILDIGRGGDCDANSLWLLEGEKPAAFVGDFIYHQNHTYMADGGILRWLANLERYEGLLKEYPALYVGHGPVCDFTAIARQKEYILSYCSELLRATGGSAAFSETSKKTFEEAMIAKYPDYGCRFMVGLAAETVAGELR